MGGRLFTVRTDGIRVLICCVCVRSMRMNYFFVLSTWFLALHIYYYHSSAIVISHFISLSLYYILSHLSFTLINEIAQIAKSRVTNGCGNEQHGVKTVSLVFVLKKQQKYSLNSSPLTQAMATTVGFRIQLRRKYQTNEMVDLEFPLKGRSKGKVQATVLSNYHNI